MCLRESNCMLMSQHSWFHAKLERIGTAIPVPPLKGDALRCSTVLPYLESYHYQADSNSDSDVYYTEHDLNRKLIDGFTLTRHQTNHPFRFPCRGHGQAGRRHGRLHQVEQQRRRRRPRRSSSSSPAPSSASPSALAAGRVCIASPGTGAAGDVNAVSGRRRRSSRSQAIAQIGFLHVGEQAGQLPAVVMNDID